MTVQLRAWLVRWMYFISIGHFVAGILLAWFSNFSFLDDYHHAVLSGFLSKDIPAAMHGLQVWWISLFGATLQNLAIFMGLLTYIGNRQRSAFIWGWMMIGLVCWAVQDMMISLQVNLWLHVWVDFIVLILMLPPLAMLWWFDRHRKSE
jgi:hypothetical protein